MVSVSYKITSFVLLVLALASWVVALAGVASLTKKCNDLEGSTKTGCAKLYQFEWWGVWFEFVVLIIALVLAFFNKFGGGNQSTLQAFFVLVTGVLMLNARFTLSETVFSGAGDLEGEAKSVNDSFAAASAGFVLLCIWNFILIILLGWGADLEVAVVNKNQPKNVEMNAPKA